MESGKLQSPFTGVETDVDLRKVNWREDTLNRLAKRYGLKNGEAYLFVNKAITRMRYIQKINGLVELVMPPMQKKNRHNNHTLMRVCNSHIGREFKGGKEDYAYLTFNEILSLAEKRIAIARKRGK